MKRHALQGWSYIAEGVIDIGDRICRRAIAGSLSPILLSSLRTIWLSPYTTPSSVCLQWILQFRGRFLQTWKVARFFRAVASIRGDSKLIPELLENWLHSTAELTAVRCCW